MQAIAGNWHKGIPGVRRDTEVGRLLEELLGIRANSSRSPDYKGIEIKAAMELGKRLCAFTDDARPTIRSAQDVVNILMADMLHLEREEFRILLLNTRCQVLARLKSCLPWRRRLSPVAHSVMIRKC